MIVSSAVRELKEWLESCSMCSLDLRHRHRVTKCITGTQPTHPKRPSFSSQSMLYRRLILLFHCCHSTGAFHYRVSRLRSSLTARMASSFSSTTDAEGDIKGQITILGFGSLLSIKSARLTFPSLQNFRLGRIPNHRRVFSHPASIFFQRGIARMDTLEMSSLSAEYKEGHSFICSVFEVPNEGLTAIASDGEGTGEWIPSRAFLEREEEFEIAMVPYEEFGLNDDCAASGVPRRRETSVSSTASVSASNSTASDDTVKYGVLCRRSTDESYLAHWGEAHFQKQYLDYGVKTIWNWDEDSGLRPCQVYTRHCVLASEGIGGACQDSFLDDTYLVDRRTTLRDYLNQYPEIMTTEPPEELKERYGG